MSRDAAPSADPDNPGAPIGFVEFVALVATMMSLQALGIDSMLPALPEIGRSLHVAAENDRQWIITAFVFGFGVAQLVHGPLADRFGRRPVLIAALASYAVANVACALAASFTLLLVARVVGGMVIAATRVAIVAMVRDCYHGRAMARVMSITFMVFMVVPVLAPTFGQTVLLFGNWRTIFWAIAALTMAVLGWFAVRMPETLHPEDRMPLSLRRIAGGWRTTATDRWSLGYTLAAAALLGALYGYLNSVQQIVADVFGRPRILVLVFAGTASLMALANLLNSRFVMRLGTRVISHGALLAMIVLAAIHLGVQATGLETLLSFAVLQALTMGCFGLATANFSAMAMEKMGHIAGTASSVQGFGSVTIGVLLGAVIGQSFNGTATPLVLGFLLAGLAALACVAVTERFRLFRPVTG
jgi:DHA1 family bicyclomycin/chloramphenicol resistance-like MFS transporter